MSDTLREFSRKVTMRLRAGEHEMDVEQFGGEYLVTGYPFSVEPTTRATMTITLDDVVDQFEINLVDGIVPGRIEQPVILQTR